MMRSWNQEQVEPTDWATQPEHRVQIAQVVSTKDQSERRGSGCFYSTSTASSAERLHIRPQIVVINVWMFPTTVRCSFAITNSSSNRLHKGWEGGREA